MENERMGNERITSRGPEAMCRSLYPRYTHTLLCTEAVVILFGKQ